MDLYADVMSALPEMQRAAESLMVDTCTVTYATGSAFDTDLGRDVTTYDTRFSSYCKVQARELVSVERDSGGHEASLIRVSVHLPVTAGPVQVDDIVTIDTSAHDPQLVGRSFRVIAPVGKSFATARRFDVEGIVA